MEHKKPEEPTEKKTITEPKEEERTKKEEADRKEVGDCIGGWFTAEMEEKKRN